MMGAALGIVVGYVLGCQAGPQGYKNLVDAWDTIRNSEEVGDLLASGFAMARELTGRAVEVVAGNLQPRQAGLRAAA